MDEVDTMWIMIGEWSRSMSANKQAWKLRMLWFVVLFYSFLIESRCKCLIWFMLAIGEV